VASIWTVIGSKYSPVPVSGAFSTEEKAQAFAAKLRLSSQNAEAPATVQEWVLDEHEGDFLMYAVVYGNYPGDKKNAPPRLERQPPMLAALPEVWSPTTFQRPGEDLVQCVAYGRSYEEAEKSLWEAIAKHKAEHRAS
jgi:hypothetical protein